ncbi:MULTISPECIES: YciI family protein [unclassified Rhodococcus (in: high G+C Gram-positive bacteria)]|uniref:YciI family protein n=1 Tax=unclassified Rhodococcus (in: high G+C Gram-positive bacteria) TaxID=192944 RepID=UPI0015C61827|nr:MULTISPECIES: YciI family protein [unclassified Rhodococcus (in: high G+C Gram-positive bacteria)]
MTLFIVTYAHPDPEGWRQHLAPHLEWIAEQVSEGTLLASGPTPPDDDSSRTAALLFRSEDEEALDRLLRTDPYVIRGQVANLTVVPWDPIFGVFNDLSTRAGESANAIIESVVDQFGPEHTTRPGSK